LGSDQIWNPKITGGQFDPIFFGSNAKCKVITYAASSRFTSLTEDQKDFFASKLCHIDNISVRETSLKNLLQPLVKKTITTVIDPSLLPDVQAYEKLCVPIKTEKKYVLIYEIDRHPYTLRIAKEIAETINAGIVELTSCVCLRNLGKRFLPECGPIEFLSYIRNAACVVTTSFHGMALSMKFQKDFYSVKQGTDADLRTESLLSKIGLLNRFITHDAKVAYTTINYQDILPKLNQEILNSKEFLTNSL
jgi:hypothetical protein